MTDARANEVGRAAQAADGRADLAAEMMQVRTADVAERDVLEVAPDALVERVAVGRVPGQWLQPQALGRAACQEVLDGLAAVDGCAVPDDEQRAGHVGEQVLEEA